ncbi:hypothetical protein [Novacetimonas pomaceti]|uniref:hypothetical protein n=1 Tax=Novacetimonas pomaceti TaxID=2021998 RepID=UPI001C2D6584|nr:hypothetical protein [Novacetimonas pomaceti]MBV1833716.1 hypothetical protein [Novacetimonas pomaceti]
MGCLLLHVPAAHGENTGNSSEGGSQALSRTYEQWYTGSLVSPSGALTKKGVFAFEPYFAYSTPTGYLDSGGRERALHSGMRDISNFTLYKYAITNAISIQTTPTISYGWRRHGDTTSGAKFGDLPVDVMWRYLNADPTRYIPALSIFAGIAFPTGDYTKLGRTEDGIGTGAYTFRLALTEQSTYTLPGHHALRLRIWGTFRRALTTAHITNTSSYGTTQGFHGTARPGMYGESGFSLEYGISQKWVLALDLARDWADGASIHGHDARGALVHTVGEGSGDWMIAPAIEYNWSPRFGIIAGVTAIFAGHDTARVLSPQFAFNSVF